MVVGWLHSCKMRGCGSFPRPRQMGLLFLVCVLAAAGSEAGELDKSGHGAREGWSEAAL